jgi:hypothetical protein
MIPGGMPMSTKSVKEYFDDVELFFCFDGMFFPQFKIDCLGKGFSRCSLKFEI